MDVATLAQKIRRRAGVGHQSMMNSLDGAITNSATTLSVERSLEHMNLISQGDCITIDNEDMHVWSADVTNRTIEVKRAVNGTDEAAHADGSLIYVNDRFPVSMVRDEILAEIRSWPRGLFAVEAVTVSFPTSGNVVDLDIGVNQERLLRPVRVLGRRDEQSEYAKLDWRLERLMDTSEFSSGLALHISPRLGFVPNGSEIRVLVALSFDLSTFDDDTDVTTDIGIPVEMIDILYYGVTARLMSFTEIERTDGFAQGESRVASEIPATHRISATKALLDWREKRIAEEVLRLMHEYGAD